MLDPHVVLQMMQTDESVQEAPIVSTHRRLVRRRQGGAAAGDGAGARRQGDRAPGAGLRHHRARRRPQAPRADDGAVDAERAGLRQDRPVQGRLVVDGRRCSSTTTRRRTCPASYQASLDGAGARGEMLAARDLPPELPEWVDTLGQDNVRALSVMLITDLLRIEEDPERADRDRARHGGAARRSVHGG